MSAGIRGTGAEILPGMLPLAHGIFRTLKFFAGFLGFQRQCFLFRLQHVQLFLDTGQLDLVLLQLPGQFALVCHRLVQLRGGLTTAFALVFEALFDAGYISASFIITGLSPVEMLVPLLMVSPQGLQ